MNRYLWRGLGQPGPLTSPVDPDRTVLVTGMPRSGTRYMTQVLNKVGIRVGHERDGKNGTVSCFHAVDDYYYPGPHRHRLRELHYHVRLHQIRHPLKVIASWREFRKPSIWHWFEKHVGFAPEACDSMTDYCADLWVAWNQICLDQPFDLRYRIEDLRSVWPKLCELLGVPRIQIPNVMIPGKRVEPAKWEELSPRSQMRVRQMAMSFGYDDI